jgi:hypothetical protein
MELCAYGKVDNGSFADNYSCTGLALQEKIDLLAYCRIKFYGLSWTDDETFYVRVKPIDISVARSGKLFQLQWNPFFVNMQF